MELQLEYMNNDKYVFKSNNLIESNYSLTVNEQRLIYMGVKKLKPIFIKANVKPSDLTTYGNTQKFGNLKISLHEFREEFGLKGNYLYEQLKSASEELFNREFMYYINEFDYVKKRWVITSRYNSNENYVSLTFHPDLILDLLIFKSRYSKLQYDVVKYLNTNYSLRLYEILRSSAHKKNRKMSILEIKEKLGIGVDKYKVYTKFKNDVIDKSLKLINKWSDINVTYTPIKAGRTTESLKFNISIKKNAKLKYMCDIPDDEHIENLIRIIGHRINGIQATELTNDTLEAIKIYGLDMGIYDYIKEKVEIVKQYAKNHVINNYFIILHTAILENWQPNIMIDTEIKFNQYENQRNYTKDEMNDLEKKLLGWDED